MAEINVNTESNIKENYFTNFNKDRNTSELGKEDFLKLLVTQLKYQDPLNPMEDKEFISQMAQFSSLEQMQNLNTSFMNVKAFSMIGKEIVANYKNEETGMLEEINGIVESVKITNGKTFVVVNGRDINVEDITDVMDTPQYQSGPTIGNYTGILNKNITATFIDPETMGMMDITGKVASLSYIQGNVYASVNGVEVQIDDVLLNEEETANFTDMKTYMEQKQENGEEVLVVIRQKDPETGNYIHIRMKGKVESFELNEQGEVVSAVLNEVKVPVNNIYTIE